MTIRRTRRTRSRISAAVAALLVATAAVAGDPAAGEDPLLVSSTYLGGSGSDLAGGAAIGPDGALWIVSGSESTDIAGAVRVPGTASGRDVLVLRLDPGTRGVLSAAWIGGTPPQSGTAGDRPVALAFDADGNAYVAGTAHSPDFPATTRFGPASTGTGFVADAFVARVSPDGTGFVWSVVVGGTSGEDVAGLCITADGDPVIVGHTTSSNFPLAGETRPNPPGNPDGFVTRIRADGSELAFSGYLSGNGDTYLSTVAAFPDGRLVVAGNTSATDLTTRGPVYGHTSPGTSRLGFLAELGAATGDLRRAALLGETDVSSISVEPGGTLLLSAASREADAGIPFAPHGHPEASDPRSGGDALLLRLDGTTWDVTGGALFGGSDQEFSVRMASAADGSLWVTGTTQSDDLPVPGATRTRRAGDRDAFVAKFDAADFTLSYASYLGGSDAEDTPHVAARPDGTAWFVGSTLSVDFPLHDPVRPRGWLSDLFLSRVRGGDPASRPGMPQDFGVVPDGPTSVRLSWTAGAGAPGTAFVVDRAEIGAFSRFATLPAGTTGWTDASVRPDRGYTYSVQAVNADGGSPRTRDVRVLTPGSVDVRIDWGRSRFDRHGMPLLFRLEGTVEGGAAPTDVRRDGLGLVLFTSNGAAQALDIAAGDRRWRRVAGRLRWRKGRTQLDFTPATGRFALRIRGFGLRAEPGESIAARVTTGGHAATTSNEWRTVFRRGLGTP